MELNLPKVHFLVWVVRLLPVSEAFTMPDEESRISRRLCTIATLREKGAQKFSGRTFYCQCNFTSERIRKLEF